MQDEAPPRKTQRKSIIFWISALAICVALALGGFWFWEMRQRPDLGAVNLVTRDVFLNPPLRSQPTLSPNGEHLAWLEQADGYNNLWLAPVDDPDSGEALTKFTDSSVEALAWSTDSQAILISIASDRGDEVWQLAVASPETHQIKTLMNGVGPRPWIIGSSAKRPHEILLLVPQAGGKAHTIEILNWTTGRRIRVLANAPYDGYVADQSLRLRIAQQAAPTGGFLWRRLGGGDLAPIALVPGEDALSTSLVSLSFDGKTLYARDSRGRDKARLVAIDVATGDITPLTPDRAEADVTDVVIDPRTGKPLLAAIEGATRRWIALDPDFKADVKAITQLGAQVSVLDISRDAKTWLLGVNDGRLSTQIYRYERGSTPQRLFSLQPDLEGQALSRTIPVAVPGANGAQLTAYFTPAVQAKVGAQGLPAQKSPLVLLVHGGPWSRDRLTFMPAHQWLANRGYHVLSVNYRGSVGFGKRLLAAGDQQWGRGIIDDLASAATWAVKAGYADADKIAVMGAAFGGYASLMSLARYNDLYACAVASHPPVDLVKLVDGVAPTDVAAFDLAVTRIGDPSEQQGRTDLAMMSPVNQIDAIKKPVLIGIGGQDQAAPENDALALAKALHARQVPVTAAIFVSEKGSFDRAANERAFLGLAEVFLKSCLGGRAEPLTADLVAKADMRVPVGMGRIPGLRAAVIGEGIDQRASFGR